jgi:putative salt-induced outer membrane protein YdiY
MASFNHGELCLNQRIKFIVIKINLNGSIMIKDFQRINFRSFIFYALFLLLVCTWSDTLSAQEVVLYLKGGDKISGHIVSENKTGVVISNTWVKSLSIPIALISKRKTINRPKAPPATHLAAKKPPESSPPTPHTQIAVAGKPIIKPHPKPRGKWRGQVRLGLDAILSRTDQQDYSGHLQLTYERPYASNPKEFFRNTTDLDAEYQRTDGQESANHASANNKSDFDLGKKAYGYGQFGAGYDEIQKINSEYQVGPGGGVHLIQHKDLAVNLEGGMDYQAQNRWDASNLETFYFRLAEDLTWRIAQNISLTEKVAFYPDMENKGQFRNEFESTLSYGFWKNLSINLTALDNYNTEVAPDVDENQFEIRSSLGVSF